jgi:hypothetical protein
MCGRLKPSWKRASSSSVIAGLDPAIHLRKEMDPRVTHKRVIVYDLSDKNLIRPRAHKIKLTEPICPSSCASRMARRSAIFSTPPTRRSR